MQKTKQGHVGTDSCHHCSFSLASLVFFVSAVHTIVQCSDGGLAGVTKCLDLLRNHLNTLTVCIWSEISWSDSAKISNNPSFLSSY